MELVYLWVEKYKNIENQGFNFSPRFKCDFDGENLDIEEDENYVSIFPNNINVTAIVGSNGSGKSSLIKNIIEYTNPHLVSYDKKRMLACWLNHKKNTIYVHTYLENLTKEKIFSKFKTHIEKTQEDFYTDEKGYEKEKFESYFYLYNNNLEVENDILDAYEHNDEYIIHAEIDKRNNIIDLEKENQKVYSYLLNHLFEKNNQYKTIINDFFYPNGISLDKSFHKFLTTNEENTKYINFKSNSVDNLTIIKLENILYLKNHFDDKNTYIFSPHKELKEIVNKLKSVDLFNKENINNINNYLLEMKNKVKSNINYIKKESKKNYNISNDEISSKLNELEKVFNLLGEETKLIEISDKDTESSYQINSNLQKKEILNFIQGLPSYLRINFHEKNGKTFNELSSGEQSLIRLIYSIKYIINKRKDKTKSFNIFLDEIENTIHPNWQKKIIKWLIELTNEFEMQINFFIASHSPFILSDIPKENVIFLKNGRQEKAFEHKQTFGANIHTLLSDGFFMDGGLMGEFAKGKIEEIKRFYELVKKLEEKILSNNKTKQLAKKSFEKRKRRFEHIKSIISEPFLQTIIKNYLDEIELLLSDDNSLIDSEINQLQKKIARLKGLKNDKLKI